MARGLRERGLAQTPSAAWVTTHSPTSPLLAQTVVIGQKIASSGSVKKSEEEKGKAAAAAAAAEAERKKQEKEKKDKADKADKDKGKGKGGKGKGGDAQSPADAPSGTPVASPPPLNPSPPPDAPPEAPPTSPPSPAAPPASPEPVPTPVPASPAVTSPIAPPTATPPPAVASPPPAVAAPPAVPSPLPPSIAGNPSPAAIPANPPPVTAPPSAPPLSSPSPVGPPAPPSQSPAGAPPDQQPSPQSPAPPTPAPVNSPPSPAAGDVAPSVSLPPPQPADPPATPNPISPAASPPPPAPASIGSAPGAAPPGGPAGPLFPSPPQPPLLPGVPNPASSSTGTAGGAAGVLGGLPPPSALSSPPPSTPSTSSSSSGAALGAAGGGGAAALVVLGLLLVCYFRRKKRKGNFIPPAGGRAAAGAAGSVGGEAAGSLPGGPPPLATGTNRVAAYGGPVKSAPPPTGTRSGAGPGPPPPPPPIPPGALLPPLAGGVSRQGAGDGLGSDLGSGLGLGLGLDPQPPEASPKAIDVVPPSSPGDGVGSGGFWARRALGLKEAPAAGGGPAGEAPQQWPNPGQNPAPGQNPISSSSPSGAGYAPSPGFNPESSPRALERARDAEHPNPPAPPAPGQHPGQTSAHDPGESLGQSAGQSPRQRPRAGAPWKMGGGQQNPWMSYEELEIATGGFAMANLLGEGGFGKVYKGQLADGRLVAVKVLTVGGGQGDREFRAEVETISLVHHRHLVTLTGHCIAGEQRLLAYEFVPNGTLEFHLHGNRQAVMTWRSRMRVAIGAAKGLAYLHEDCTPRIIHRDIKAANILLDDQFEAEVADFGLAKLQSDEMTHYAMSGRLTEKSDVFSFGVVLLELLTGRRPTDPTLPSGEESLVQWARPLLANNQIATLVDSRLDGNYDAEELVQLAAAAALCVRYSAHLRPKLSQVARMLEGVSDIAALGHSSNRPGVSQSFIAGDLPLGADEGTASDDPRYSAHLRTLMGESDGPESMGTGLDSSNWQAPGVIASDLPGGMYSLPQGMYVPPSGTSPISTGGSPRKLLPFDSQKMPGSQRPQLSPSGTPQGQSSISGSTHPASQLGSPITSGDYEPFSPSLNPNSGL
eukprot:jgi/Mesen1/8416/ME000471S07726